LAFLLEKPGTPPHLPGFFFVLFMVKVVLAAPSIGVVSHTSQPRLLQVGAFFMLAKRGSGRSPSLETKQLTEAFYAHLIRESGANHEISRKRRFWRPRRSRFKLRVRLPLSFAMKRGTAGVLKRHIPIRQTSSSTSMRTIGRSTPKNTGGESQGLDAATGVAAFGSTFSGNERVAAERRITRCHRRPKGGRLHNPAELPRLVVGELPGLGQEL
jgi:hypothetical protein